MGRRWMKGVGAALMEGGRQAEISRREEMEKLKEENLMKIANQRDARMGEQLGIMRQGNEDRSTYQTGMLGVAQDTQAATASHQTEMQAQSKLQTANQGLIIQGNQDQMGQAREHAEAARIRDADRQKATTALQQTIANINQQAANTADAKQRMAELNNFNEKIVPNAYSKNLDIKDLHQEKMYQSALTYMVENGAMAMTKPEDFEKMVGTMKENLDISEEDASKLDFKGFSNLLKEIKSQRDIYGLTEVITDGQLRDMVRPYLRVGGGAAAGAAVDDAAIEAPGTGYGHEYGLFGGDATVGERATGLMQSMQGDPGTWWHGAGIPGIADMYDKNIGIPFEEALMGRQNMKEE